MTTQLADPKVYQSYPDFDLAKSRCVIDGKLGRSQKDIKEKSGEEMRTSRFRWKRRI